MSGRCVEDKDENCPMAADKGEEEGTRAGDCKEPARGKRRHNRLDGVEAIFLKLTLRTRT